MNFVRERKAIFTNKRDPNKYATCIDVYNLNTLVRDKTHTCTLHVDVYRNEYISDEK